jgi:murein DD-endopeptidase MepM/ murein hydrolase activator NlpD
VIAAGKETAVHKNLLGPLAAMGIAVLALLVASCSEEDAQPYVDAAQQTAIAQAVSAGKTQAAQLQQTAVSAAPGVKETAAAEAQKVKQTAEAAAKGAVQSGVSALCTRLADQAAPDVIFTSLPVTPKWTNGFGAITFARDNWGGNYTGTSGLHGGIDFGCSTGTSIRAGVWGTLEGTSGDATPNVVVKVGDWYITYGHVTQSKTLAKSITPDTVVGVVVDQGTNTHLHLSVRRKSGSGGRFYNSLSFFPRSMVSGYDWGPYIAGENAWSMRSFMPQSTTVANFWKDQTNCLISIER